MGRKLTTETLRQHIEESRATNQVITHLRFVRQGDDILVSQPRRKETDETSDASINQESPHDHGLIFIGLMGGLDEAAGVEVEDYLDTFEISEDPAERAKTIEQIKAMIQELAEAGFPIHSLNH